MQVWLKLPPDSGEEDFLILVMHFRISKIILEKRGALYLNKLEFPLTQGCFVPSLVEIDTLVLVKEIF